jgi:hypothetical protein
MQWDWTMTNGHPLGHQGPSDLAALTGGILFGMQPNIVNTLVPDPTPTLDWADLALVSELTQDVRYFWIKVAGARDLAAGISGCYGANSYIVLLFRDRSLFRLSYRFLPDPGCASPHEAALSVFARFTAISNTIAVTAHYRVGTTEVVDITDPGSGDLLHRRWLPRGQ